MVHRTRTRGCRIKENVAADNVAHASAKADPDAGQAGRKPPHRITITEFDIELDHNSWRGAQHLLSTRLAKISRASLGDVIQQVGGKVHKLDLNCPRVQAAFQDRYLDEYPQYSEYVAIFVDTLHMRDPNYDPALRDHTG